MTTGERSSDDLQELAEAATTVVCTGSGGVGKTTTAAVIALEAARRGRKACVVTIDPARRLADALGLDELTNDPSPIVGDWPGELSALMLDTKSTFDELVAKHSETPEQAAVRETAEEAGLTVKAVKVLGDRVHPKTGRQMHYVACAPIEGEARVADEEELDAVAWVAHGEIADHVPYGLFEPVQEYLDGVLAG